MGGLSKKAFQIHSFSQSKDPEILLLDAGNLLFKRPPVGTGPSQERITARYIMDIYQGLGFDAVGVGPLDLAGSLDMLKNRSAKGFPWVSANILDENGKPLFKQWVTVKKGNSEFLITSLSAQSKRLPSNITIEKPEIILPRILAEITSQKDAPFIILLSTLSNDENRIIAEQYPELHLIIGSDSSKGNFSAKLINKCLLTQIGKQGKYQGVLEIIPGTARVWGTDTGKLLADLQNKLGSVNWQLRRLLKKTASSGNKEKVKETISRLGDEQHSLETQIATLKVDLEQEKVRGDVNDEFSARFIALKKNMPNDQPTVEKLQRLNQDIRALNRKQREQQKQKQKLSALTLGMTGYKTCQSCHQTQADFWKTTAHASAYETLAVKNKQLDLDCLPCHLTLKTPVANNQIARNNGYLAYPIELQAVGCESCHGSGKAHSENPESLRLTRLPLKTICLTCHTPDHDDNFVYENKIKLISCPAE